MSRFEFRTYWPLYVIAIILYGVVSYVLLAVVMTVWRSI